MAWLSIALLVATAFLLLLPLLTYLSARRQVGKAVDEEAPGGGTGDRLIYFYSPTCGPCRQMTPLVEHLAEQHSRVYKVDVMQDQETARAFNIRATPTTVLVKDGRVLDIALGAKSRAQLENLLKRVA